MNGITSSPRAGREAKQALVEAVAKHEDALEAWLMASKTPEGASKDRLHVVKLSC